jgi:putative DNA primase/helicase
MVSTPQNAANRKRDWSETISYLSALTGQPGATVSVCWQTFDDSPAKRGALARCRHGSLRECSAALSELNRDGAGVFVAVNAVAPDRPRQKENVPTCRCWWAELDGAETPPLPLAPSVVVQSANGQHLYWLADSPQDPAATERQNKAIAAAIGADPRVWERTRVLRVPGFLHLKDPEHPFPVRLLSADATRRYTAAQIAEAFPAHAPAKTSQRPEQPSAGPDREQRIERARRYLAACPPAITGQGGGARTLLACEHVVLGFDLSEEDALEAMRQWNARCQPPWDTEAERGANSLRRKIREAATKGTAVAVGQHLREDRTGGVPTTRQVISKSAESKQKQAREAISRPPPPTDADAPPPERDYIINGPAPKEWPTPRPLRTAAPVPHLEPNMLPEALRPWLCDEAERACIPLEFVAVPALVALGAIIGRTVGIRPGERDNWTKAPNLWGAIVARPGQLKSHALEVGTRPLGKLSARAFAEYDAKRVEREAAAVAIEGQIAAAKRRSDSARADLEALIRERDALEVTCRRYKTNDATVEKIGMLLADNPRGMLLVRDELVGWIAAMDKAGREGERQFWLEAWNGSGEFIFDRVKRGTTRISNLCMSVVGAIQPARLSTYVAQSLDGGGGDGLLQRLQLLVWPDDIGQWRTCRQWPDVDGYEDASAIFERLDVVRPEALGAQPDERLPFLRFSEVAQRSWDSWRDHLETRLRGHEMEPTPAFEAHLGKYRSLCPSLALIFELVAGARDGHVGGDALAIAIAWCDYLEAHARKVYADELAPGRSAADALAKAVQTRAVADGDTPRAIIRSARPRLDTADAVYGAIRELEALGWVRLEHLQPTAAGRPTEALRINPEVLRGN